MTHPISDWTKGDVDALAQVIYGEARGEPAEGQAAVAWVAINRAIAGDAYFAKHRRSHPLFGSGSLTSAIYAPRQFSCFNPGDPNKRAIDAAHVGDPVFLGCFVMAGRVLLGEIPAPQGIGPDVRYYCTTVLGWPKAWGEPREPVAVIGRHSFYVVD